MILYDIITYVPCIIIKAQLTQLVLYNYLYSSRNKASPFVTQPHFSPTKELEMGLVIEVGFGPTGILHVCAQQQLYSFI